MNDFEHFSGCLLGGAVGDALGAPVEFHSLDLIRKSFGPEGVTDYVELNANGQAEFTDDTQMSLFTAEGLLYAIADTGRSDVTACVAASYIYQAYLRWLRTQYTESTPLPPHQSEGYLLKQPALWKRKAPGNTCLSALYSHKMGSVDKPINNSKGCGGVMRAAPVGLILPAREAFALGCESAAITHGHVSGYLPSGCMAQMIALLLAGYSLESAVQSALETLAQCPGHEETMQALSRAVAFANNTDYPATPHTVEQLGAGWVAEEALAIAVYCALIGAREGSFARGVLLAVNHSGDSDSTGAMTGNLLGLLFGRSAIPESWVARIELRELLEEIAGDLLTGRSDPEQLYQRYETI